MGSQCQVYIVQLSAFSACINKLTKLIQSFEITRDDEIFWYNVTCWR